MRLLITTISFQLFRVWWSLAPQIYGFFNAVVRKDLENHLIPFSVLSKYWTQRISCVLPKGLSQQVIERHKDNVIARTNASVGAARGNPVMDLDIHLYRTNQSYFFLFFDLPSTSFHANVLLFFIQYLDFCSKPVTSVGNLIIIKFKLYILLTRGHYGAYSTCI